MTTRCNLVLFLIIPISLLAQSKSVLFIGNSYTGVNNLPVMTKDLALSLGDTLNIDSNTPGGTTFNAHTSNATTLAKISQGIWDYVILQAQSQEPSFPPSQVATQTYPYAATLVDSILSANECTVPLFYMTWGRKNGDQNNCQFYAPLCTYSGMQARIRESYLEMATDNDAEVSPVGAAWKYVRDNHPSIELYSADESHPSAAGSYLAACVHYASIYKKSPNGASFIFSLSAGDAAILQNAAKLIVMDSLGNWNFGVTTVQAGFNYAATSGLGFQFTNSSQNATDFLWDFGDGISSTLPNPNHTYSTTGNYSVTLISSNNCGADTTTSQLQVISNSIEELKRQGYFVHYENNVITLQNKNNVQSTVQLISMEGKVLFTKTIQGSSLAIEAPSAPSLYILAITDNTSGKIFSKKLVKQ